MNIQARRIHRRALTAGAICLVALLQCGVAVGGTWKVERDGSGDFVVIRDAVIASSPGDTILVGPGRFPEHAPFQLGTTNLDTYVGVNVDNLTIIGTGPDETIVGPTTPDIVGFEPRGFAFGVNISKLTVENLRVENVRDGFYAADGSLCLGAVQIANCRNGVALLTAMDSRINTTTIDSCQTGISTFPGSDGLVVSDLFVLGSGTAIITQQADNVLLERINVAGTVAGISIVSGSSATIRDARVITTGVSLGVTGGSVVDLARSTLISDLKAVRVSGQNSLLLGSDNSFRGGSFAVIHMVALGNAVISSSDILRDKGLAVFADGYQFEPIFDIDLRNNFWGTTEADSISAWIIDGNDLHDPPLDPNYSNVLFEPFREQSIPTAKRSLGFIKAAFGRPDGQ